MSTRTYSFPPVIIAKILVRFRSSFSKMPFPSTNVVIGLFFAVIYILLFWSFDLGIIKTIFAWGVNLLLLAASLILGNNDRFRRLFSPMPTFVVIGLCAICAMVYSFFLFWVFRLEIKKIALSVVVLALYLYLIFTNKYASSSNSTSTTSSNATERAAGANPREGAPVADDIADGSSGETPSSMTRDEAMPLQRAARREMDMAGNYGSTSV